VYVCEHVVYACAVLCVRVCLRDARVCVCVFARMCTFTCVRACVCVCARAREQTRDAHGRTIPCRDFAVRAKFEAALPAATEQISIIGQPCTSAGFCFSALETTPPLRRATHILALGRARGWKRDLTSWPKRKAKSCQFSPMPVCTVHTPSSQHCCTCTTCANTPTAYTVRMCEHTHSMHGVDAHERMQGKNVRSNPPASSLAFSAATRRWSSASELMLPLRVDLTDWPWCNTR